MKENELKIQDQAIVLEAEAYSSSWDEPGKLDSYIELVCLERTIGEVFYQRENAVNARTYWVACLIFNAVFEQDIGSIDQIISRLDGLVPEKDKREEYANIFGCAIDDVMDLPLKEQTRIEPDDLVLVALAKVVYQVSVSLADDNFSRKKERQQAIDMILKRTGGRPTAPVKKLIETEYVDPDWMKGLDDGNNSGETTVS